MKNKSTIWVWVLCVLGIDFLVSAKLMLENKSPVAIGLFLLVIILILIILKDEQYL
jgi:hypothetical protein